MNWRKTKSHLYLNFTYRDRHEGGEPLGLLHHQPRLEAALRFVDIILVLQGVHDLLNAPPTEHQDVELQDAHHVGEQHAELPHELVQVLDRLPEDDELADEEEDADGVSKSNVEVVQDSQDEADFISRQPESGDPPQDLVDVEKVGGVFRAGHIPRKRFALNWKSNDVVEQ